jgi:hemoglobin
MNLYLPQKQKMRDIESRKDIEKLINCFYEKVMQDEAIGFFFKEIVPINWENHLPVMYDFWESIVFNTHNYKGNTMEIHKTLNTKSALKPEHFKQWLTLFKATVNEMYIGNNATLIEQRATSIATVMQIKIAQSLV